jgi:hypothetical protein
MAWGSVPWEAVAGVLSPYFIPITRRPSRLIELLKSGEVRNYIDCGAIPERLLHARRLFAAAVEAWVRQSRHFFVEF